MLSLSAGVAGLVVTLFATPAWADPWPTLAAHYKLDETDTGSTVVYDERGAVHGTRAGSVTIGQPGIDGTAYSFVRSDANYVDLNRQDLIPQTDPFKLELSFNTSLTNTHYLLSSYISSSSSRTLLYGTSGKVHFAVGGGTLSLETPTGFADSKWHRITLTREYVEATDNDLFKLYVDGTLYDSEATSTDYAIGGGTNPTWRLSGSPNVSGRGFAGMIDDIRVYVPEPSSIALLLAAAGMMLLRRSRA
jgi:hypothetical protein